MKKPFSQIWLDNTVGISIGDIEAGLAAAMEVFHKHNLEPIGTLNWRPDVWAEAQQAAVQAAYKGWKTIPDEVRLILVEQSKGGQSDE